jgi:transposase
LVEDQDRKVEEKPSMIIVGCDFHPSWQQVNWLDTETGETGERQLVHAEGEAQQFYRGLAAPVLVGMEATGNSQWFVELIEDLGHAIWIGDAAQIRASYVRKQKTDKRDAAHILKLLVEGRFPRLWAPDREQRDVRQLVLHRHKLVLIRSRVKNELQHLSLNKGMQRRARLWSEHGLQLLRELPLEPWASCRREDLLSLLTMLDEQIGKLDRAVQQAAEENPLAKLLMTQPGVGPNTALSFVLTLGEVSRFRRGKQVASYLGLIPREETSGGRQKLGSITKQGNRMLRSLLVEAAQVAVRYDPQFRREYLHRCHRKPKAVAKVAAARKLAVRLYWMLRTQTAHPEIVRIESSSRVALVGAS